MSMLETKQTDASRAAFRRTDIELISQDGKEATLVQWYKQPGEKVGLGEPLAEVMNGQGSLEIESPVDAVLLEQLIGVDGKFWPTGTIIGRLQQSLPMSPWELAKANIPDDEAQPVRGAQAPAAEPQSARPIISLREALHQALAEEMELDSRVFLMGEEIGEYNGTHKVTQGLLHKFGEERVIDTPITEHGFTGICVGAALGGLRPVVEFMSFAYCLQALDHIFNSAAKVNYLSGGRLKCPIVFRGPNGWTSQTAAEYAVDFTSLFAHVPGLKVVAPATPADAKGLLKSAIRDPNPVVFLESEGLYGDIDEVAQGDEALVPIGKARIARAGKDISLFAYSASVSKAIHAADLLANDGIDVEVIDLRTLRPLDETAIITSLQKTGRGICIEHGTPQGGIGAEIAALAMEKAFEQLKGPVLRLCAADVPMPYAAKLEKAALPQATDVLALARRMMKSA